MLLRNNMLSQCKRCKQVKDDVHYCSWGHHSALCKAGNIPSRINVLNPPDSLVSNERDQTGGATEYKVVKLDKQGVAASKAKKKLPPSECHSLSTRHTALQSSQQVCNWLKAEKKLLHIPYTVRWGAGGIRVSL